MKKDMVLSIIVLSLEIILILINAYIFGYAFIKLVTNGYSSIFSPTNLIWLLIIVFAILVGLGFITYYEINKIIYLKKQER